MRIISLEPTVFFVRDGGALPAAESFAAVDVPNVLLLAFKQAEDGNGLIARLIETEGRPAHVTLSVPRLSMVAAYAANVVEEDQRLLPCTRHTVTADVKPFGFATIRLVPGD